MRLLFRDNTGLLSLEDYTSSATTPPYAILSHTWGRDEVTYEDLISHAGLQKDGYRKIRFCAEQAERDGLRYFWVDTCCINKSSSAELSESINSMFRWYSNACKCYTYLEDVSSPAPQDRDQDNGQDWRLQFQRSRWFTRAWTLQELIAPATVDFFSGTGEKLGSKASLEPLICDVTGIPAQVLRGSQLHHYTTTERMAWAQTREATKPEDIAYSLLGIFDVQMPLIYGEGKEKALKRLREEIHKDQKGSQHEEFSVPFSLYDVPEIEHFVAREDELAEVHETLRSDGSRRVIVFHGLGGIGKTQLAIAYTKRHKDRYSAIFWINISDESSLSKSFIRIASQIIWRHPSAKPIINISNKESPHEAISGVKAWLSLPNNTRWLLVYDNYDNPKLPNNADPAAIDIQEYLPEAYQGSIMITTRSSEVKIGHAIRMGKLQNVDDSLKILSTTSKRKELTSDPDAVRLAEELDGLPLALATAGAYLEQTSISFGSYLNLYKSSWVRLQTSTPQLGSYADRTLHSTWELSYNQIRQRNESSATLLQLWAYFPQHIWLELLQSDNKHNILWIHEITRDELSFTNAVRTLIDYGLVEVDNSNDELLESRGYSVHSCVYSWITHVLVKQQSTDLVRYAIRCVASRVCKPEYKSWVITKQLLQHAARYDLAILDTVKYERHWIYALSKIYGDQDKPKDAEEMCNWALTLVEKVFGTHHPNTFKIFEAVGTIFANYDNWKKAREIYQRALQGKEKNLGPNDDSTLFLMNKIGITFSQQGMFEDAEDVFQQILQRKHKSQHTGNTSINAIYNLAVVFVNQGKLIEAERMYLRGLKWIEKALGPNQISRADIAYSPGRAFFDQEKLKDAEELCHRALNGKKNPKYTAILDTLLGLGSVLCAQGKLMEAEELYYRTLQGRARCDAPGRQSTLDVVYKLGDTLHTQDKLKDCEELYHWTLQGTEKHLGPNHISTLNVVYWLGSIFDSQGKLKEADEMYHRALQGFQIAYGSDHRSTQDVLKRIETLAVLRDSLLSKSNEDSKPLGNSTRTPSHQNRRETPILAPQPWIGLGISNPFADHLPHTPPNRSRPGILETASAPRIERNALSMSETQVAGCGASMDGFSGPDSSPLKGLRRSEANRRRDHKQKHRKKLSRLRNSTPID
ncbi:hypothetical protein F4679DRAFT_146121 [Xylaria curta]|nr:hypothetical protein F4679DRAFT_146121 [Xylaria curta]